jgi:hypothetical protein
MDRKGGTMSIRTRTTTNTTSTLTEGDREFTLPIDTGHADEYRITDLANGHTIITYLALDPYGGDHWTPEELFSGWEYTLLTDQRDADIMWEKFNLCDECETRKERHVDDGEADCEQFTNAAQRSIADGRCFYIEKYEHGLVRYALVGESSAVDRQWDVTGVAGYMMADDDWGKDVDIEQAARSTLEQYTDWCNGTIYGVITVEYAGPNRQVTEEESCWGYIGDEHARQELKDNHESWCKIHGN